MNAIPKMLIAASAIALTAAPRAWGAPQQPVQAPVQAAAEIKNEMIRPKNVPPSWLAQMLVSKPFKPRDTTALPAGAVIARMWRNGVRTDIKKGTPEGDKFEADEKARAEAALKNPNGLPEGIESLTPDDAKGEIHVRGTADGIAKLRDVIKYLDLPLRKVDLEVQTVSLDRADLQRFGLDGSKTVGPLQFGFVGQDIRANLQNWLDANGARVLLDARLTIINNLSGLLRQGGRYGASIGIPSSEVQLTPTINNDDTITVVIESTTGTPGLAAGGTKTQSVANVRDGDTIVLSGLNAGEQTTVTFLTARIVRRANEKAEKK